jgi:hypothetical protein
MYRRQQILLQGRQHWIGADLPLWVAAITVTTRQSQTSEGNEDRGKTCRLR